MMKLEITILLFTVLLYQLSQGKYIQKTKCLHTSQGGKLVPVKCDIGKSCYAIASVHHVNGTWKTKPYSVGCWETQPYCHESECTMEIPNYIWVEHHFPRFCCCNEDFCNKHIKLSD